MKKISNDSKIYRAYIEAKNNKTPMESIMTQFKISRTAIYDVVKRVKQGDVKKIQRSLITCRNECLWQHQFKSLFESLPKDRKLGTVTELKDLIKKMKLAGFPETHIAKKLTLNRSTVRHHLR